MDNIFFMLLRTAMNGEPFTANPTDDEWRSVYAEAKRQSLLGVLYSAVCRMKMPRDMALQWATEAEAISGLNQLLNKEAARLTRLFAGHGRQTAILKGQANARLYPNPLSRQPGDIDIWVEGGRESVLQLLREMGMMTGRDNAEKPTTSYHHVHLPANEQGITVEVHFRPASGNLNPLTNHRLQQWLLGRITDSCQQVEQGFNVPSLQFALVMQLAHIQRHFLSGGIGLRQVCDYYLLLQSATEEDRHEVSSNQKRFGLAHTAGALMWLLEKGLHLDKELMLCQPDSYRGEWMLREIMEGGNFGHYAKRQEQGLWRRFFLSKRRQMQLMRFDFKEMAWVETKYWEAIIKTLPKRIRYRTLSLKDIPR